jgi:hypothetical protein
MATIETQILSWFYGLTALATLETIALVLTKRHVQKGLKIWFYRKFKKNPVQIVYVGPDNNVEEHVVLAKGEYVVAGNKVFNVQPKRIKMSADNIPQLFYNWKSCVPANFADADSPAHEAFKKVGIAELPEKKKGLNKLRLELKGKVVQFLGKRVDGLSEEFFGELGAVFEPIDPQKIDVQTSPEALNKFMELVDIEAKKNADQSIQKWEKWLKYGFFALLGVIALSFFTYNIVNGSLKPQMEEAITLLQQIHQMLQAFAQHSGVAVPGPVNATMTV